VTLRAVALTSLTAYRVLFAACTGAACEMCWSRWSSPPAGRPAPRRVNTPSDWRRPAPGTTLAGCFRPSGYYR